MREIVNINPAFGDSVKFDGVEDMTECVNNLGYLPEDGLKEGRDYDFVNKITVVENTDDDELYLRYPTDIQQQPSYIYLRSWELSTAVSGDIGYSIPADVFAGKSARWKIPSLRANAANRVMHAIVEKCVELMEMMDDGNGRSEDAYNLAAEIEHEIAKNYRYDNDDVYDVWAAEDWFSHCNPKELSADTTDDEIEDIADREIENADAELDRDDIIRYLTSERGIMRDREMNREDN